MMIYRHKGIYGYSIPIPYQHVVVFYNMVIN
jgi:hypothetical protein